MSDSKVAGLRCKTLDKTEGSLQFLNQINGHKVTPRSKEGNEGWKVWLLEPQNITVFSEYDRSDSDCPKFLIFS